MSKTRIRRALERTLLHHGAMAHALYVYELEELVEELTASMVHDHDAFLFAVTENNNDVAMVLIEPPNTVFINEHARMRLQELWVHAYAQNMQRLIPPFTQQLARNEIPINGVKVVNNV
ncbi:hypothetical protein K2Z83_12030 [Oscillochloris sp. ZM17-4]|uniref:hypothetical protein n=1 Tax=Oscillochloris sp. ZM17-4 TaxID=2866714 RepID=UPI001C7346A7|nr:hypothetical protein [Oscillochloris sp. ZM17-4]MBX0328404.1 hypothetical protein [Oscillochloris sp. ZM17-4]